MSDKPAPYAKLHWSDDGQPLSSEFDDVYFSRHDGLAETRHVFIDSNHLPARWQALAPGEAFTIAETGFGTGLNFLATWQLWQQLAPKGCQLHYISVEKYPLSLADLQRALALWPTLAPFASQLQDKYPQFLHSGVHRITFTDGVKLTLIIDDAALGFNRLQSNIQPDQPGFKVDAWYLDGFAPSKNPAMWSQALFDAIRHLSGPATSAATFSAAGIVKRGLISAGFEIAKVPGFGRKREMLTATHAEEVPRQLEQGLVQTASSQPKSQSAIVIGAGLAGSHTARALAERGWKVQVLEAHDEPAAGGSGNPQGLVYGKLSHRQETLPLFNLSALTYACRYYQPYWTNPALGQKCGLLQIASSRQKTDAYKAIIDSLGDSQSFVKLLDAEAASNLAGVSLKHGGLYFADCGWINPKLLCRELLDHENISVSYSHPCETLKRDGESWQLTGPQGEQTSAPIVILCSAQATVHFKECAHLPLKPIRGQVSYLPARGKSRRLKIALCERGYMAPAHSELHCVGATFNLHNESLALTLEDHQENLQHMQAFGDELCPTNADELAHSLTGRAAFRCTTPDYLPIVGPAPVADSIRQTFAPLAKNAKARLTQPAHYWPGLYLNCGHGSRGLAYTPIAAELLASLINIEPLPLPQALANALHPARFLVRDIIRGR